MKTRFFTGGASVLVILVMFIMLSLGALRLMSSFADLKLSRASAGRLARHYELEKEANGKLQKINMALANSFNAESHGFSRDKLRFLENDGWSVQEIDGKIFIRCNVSLEGEIAQNLFVELLLSPPDENGRYYKIFQWRQWQDGFEYEQEGLDIWTG
jgi:hypothetical protein